MAIVDNQWSNSVSHGTMRGKLGRSSGMWTGSQQCGVHHQRDGNIISLYLQTIIGEACLLDLKGGRFKLQSYRWNLSLWVSSIYRWRRITDLQRQIVGKRKTQKTQALTTDPPSQGPVDPESKKWSTNV